MRMILTYSMMILACIICTFSLTSCGEEQADIVIQDTPKIMKKHHHKKSAFPIGGLSSFPTSQDEANHAPSHSVIEGHFNGQDADISPQTVTPDTQVTYGANH